MPSTRTISVFEYPVLKGFTGQEHRKNVTIDPSKISGFAADALGNYRLGAGTILTPTTGGKHTVVGGWVTGNTDENVQAPVQGNNGTSVTAQVQELVITGTPTGGTFRLVDEKGNETANINYNATAAEVQAALRALPGASAGYTCTGGSLPGTAVKITTAGGLLGVKRSLSVGTEAFTGGTAPKAAVTTTTEGQYIEGILATTLWFDDATSGSTKAAAMLMFNCAFDKSRIQNFAFYQRALEATLRNSTFE